MNFCPNCGNKTTPESAFCMMCGYRLTASSGQTAGEENVFEKVTNSIGKMSGVSGKVDLKLKDLFSDVFKRHTTPEAETIFISGTSTTTPPEETIGTTWPKPWLYTRTFLMFLVTFFLLYICVFEFESLNALPGLIMIGSLMVPFSLILFFMELNVPRNISFYTIAKIFFIGGCASLVVTLFLYGIFPTGELDYGGAILTGIIEEIGKLIIVVFIIYRMPKIKYMLNGMLIGAAVGAGFAAFESAGYAFRYALEYGADTMMDVILLRAFLSPGGHIVWAAISGAALMLVKQDQPLKSDFFFKKTFFSFFIIPVVLHSIWDMPIEFGSAIYLLPILLTVAAWIVILVLVNVGLNQIANNKFVKAYAPGVQGYGSAEPVVQPQQWQ